MTVSPPSHGPVLISQSDTDDTAGGSPSPSPSRVILRGPTDVDVETQRIRDRFLHRLGIAAPMSPPLPFSTAMGAPSADTLKPSRSTNSFQQALKDDDCSSSYDDSLASSRLMQVHFAPAVLVHEIPSRYQYSSRIAQELWTPMDEFQQNICRNSLEFAAERYDWKQVVGDEDMIVVGTERIHPIHFGIVLDEYRDEEEEKGISEEVSSEDEKQT